MKNQISYNIFFAVLLFSTTSGMAQLSSERGLPPRQTSVTREADNIHDGKTTIMLSPQFVWIDQIRIEIDRRIKHGHWISFAPHYVQNNIEYQTHWGFGLASTYRWFTGIGSTTYIGAGLQFTHHVLENSGFDVLSKTDMWLYRTNITQGGINAITGQYFRILPNIYCDIHVGIGYRLSSTKTSDGKPHEFRNRYFNLAHQGFVFVFGVRFGIML
jgi:hypothetical protein